MGLVNGPRFCQSNFAQNLPGQLFPEMGMYVLTKQNRFFSLAEFDQMAFGFENLHPSQRAVHLEFVFWKDTCMDYAANVRRDLALKTVGRVLAHKTCYDEQLLLYA